MSSTDQLPGNEKEKGRIRRRWRCRWMERRGCRNQGHRGLTRAGSGCSSDYPTLEQWKNPNHSHPSQTLPLLQSVSEQSPLPTQMSPRGLVPYGARVATSLSRVFPNNQPSEVTSRCVCSFSLCYVYPPSLSLSLSLPPSYPPPSTNLCTHLPYTQCP